MNKFNEYLEAAIELRESDVEELNEISFGKKLSTLGNRALGAVTGGRFGKEKRDEEARGRAVGNAKMVKRDEVLTDFGLQGIFKKRYNELYSLSSEININNSDEIKKLFIGFKPPGGYRLPQAVLQSRGNYKSFVNNLNDLTGRTFKSTTDMQEVLSIELRDAINYLKNK